MPSYTASLAGACLRQANLISCRMNNVDLWHADLTGAVLTCADLRDADLTGAQLYGADLVGADLAGAVLHKTRGDDETRLPEGYVVIDGLVVRLEAVSA